jgi:ABC-type nitrate/sulfonate/bicarbonate transport system substrate-binding protein
LKVSPFRVVVFLLAVLCPLTSAALAAYGHDELTEIDVQLRWKHQFQFAGYYAAVEQGYYRDAGLDVRLHEGAPGRDPVDEVLAGRAQYGESNSEVLYERLRGKPLVALAAIFQHSPSVLLARAGSGIRTPHDLVGKKVMLMDGRHDADFHAMFLREGIRPESMTILPASYEIGDIVAGKVDAVNSYLTNEPYFLQQQGVGYVVINPSHYGVDYYSDVLFTTEQEVRRHPERVAAFRAATLRGWRYAMDNPGAVIDLLIDKYQVAKSREHLEFEARAMRSLILPDLVDIGHMNPGRWQSMADAFKAVGMVDQNASLDGFVYDPHPHIWEARIRKIVVFLGSIIGAILLALLGMYGVQKRLKKEISLRKEVEARLSHSNEMLERTGKLAKVGGWENDFLNNRSSWTDEAARIREIPPGTVMTNEQAIAFYEPEAQQVVRAANAAAVKDGTPWDHELPMITATGRRIWVRNRGQPVIRDGRTVLLTGTIQDITERKLAEQALLRRTRELEMHNSVLRQIHQGTPLVEMLESITRQVEALHPEMLAVDPAARRRGKASAGRRRAEPAGLFQSGDRRRRHRRRRRLLRNGGVPRRARDRREPAATQFLERVPRSGQPRQPAFVLCAADQEPPRESSWHVLDLPSSAGATQRQRPRADRELRQPGATGDRAPPCRRADSQPGLLRHADRLAEPAHALRPSGAGDGLQQAQRALRRVDVS